MDYKKWIILFSLLVFNTVLFAQIDNYVNLAIKDTTVLKKLIKETIAEAKQNQKINNYKINSILKSSLELQDTTSFFYFFYRIEMYYYVRNGLHEKAILFVKDCQDILKNPKTKFGEFDNSLGKHYDALGFLAEALVHYYKSLEWYEQFEEPNMTVPLGNIAEIYFKNRDYNKALEYNALALKYSLKLPDKKDRLYNIIYDYFRIGAIYHKLHFNEDAEIYYQKSLDAAREYKETKLLLMTLVEGIKFYISINEFKKCEQLILEGDILLYDTEIQNTKTAQLFLLEKSNFYLKNGYLDKALNPKEIDFKNTSLKNEMLLYSANYYNHLKDAENSAKFYNKLLAEQARAEKESRNSILSNIEENYVNRGLKESNRNLVESIEQRKRLVNIIGGILVFISSLLIFQIFYSRKYRKLNELLKAKTAEQVTLNQELANSNSELERFAFIVSHDLKTPLRDVVSFTELLERLLKEHENESVHEYLAFIKKGGKRLNSLIDNTLEYSRISFAGGNNQEEVVDLNNVLSELESSIVNFLKERKASITKLNKLPTIKSKYSLVPVFHNLIENGIHYNKNEHPTISFSYQKNKETFSIFVEDNGIGIPKEYHDKIFIMFSRLHNQDEYKGSGLGLSICKRLIDKLNGEIIIKSEIGKGTIFEIKLPVHLLQKEEGTLQGVLSDSEAAI